MQDLRQRVSKRDLIKFVVMLLYTDGAHAIFPNSYGVVEDRPELAPVHELVVTTPSKKALAHS